MVSRCSEKAEYRVVLGEYHVDVCTERRELPIVAARQTPQDEVDIYGHLVGNMRESIIMVYDHNRIAVRLTGMSR